MDIIKGVFIEVISNLILTHPIGYAIFWILITIPFIIMYLLSNNNENNNDTYKVTRKEKK